jgi:hypothetical protein
MRSLEKQISIARERSGNLTYSYDKSLGVIKAGLSQDFFVESAREAQQHLQQQIIAIKADLFLYDEITAVVANKENYTLSGKVFGQTKIKSVQFSTDSSVKRYVPLPNRTLAERDTSEATYPDFYIPKGQEILLNPIPTAAVGSFRTTYYRELDDVDVRRAVVSGTPSGVTISLVDDDSCYGFDLKSAEYICISDNFGNQLLSGAKISSYNNSTKVITLAANVSTYLVSGYTLANLADQYVTIGRYSTTHCKLPDICERYIMTYMQKRALQKEQNEGSLFEDLELTRMQESILGAYSEKTEDVTEVPILDTGILY